MGLDPGMAGRGLLSTPERRDVQHFARRLAKDFEATVEPSLAWLLIALAFLLTRRLARLSGPQT